MKERGGRLILVVRIFIRYVCAVFFVVVHLCYFLSVLKETYRHVLDVSRAGRNVCDTRIVRADGLATKGGTEDKMPSQGY